MSNIKIKNTEFYYKLHGQGHPLVLVSGYAADHHFWDPILPELSKHFQVLVFDNRGIGLTQDQDTFPLSADIFADDIKQLIDALGLKKPHIVGQSMGGTMVQSFAARYPDDINKLVILNSTLKWRKAMLLGIQSMLNVGKEASFDTFFDLNLSWVFGEAFLQNPEQVALRKGQFINDPNPPSPANLVRQFAALEHFDGRANASIIKAPTLVVSGLEDIISLPYESKAIADSIQNAQLLELPGGHAITMEVPKELTRILMEFLK